MGNITKRRRTADSDNCSEKSKQPDDDRVEVNAPVDEELLESSENEKNKLIMFLVLMTSARKYLG